MNHPEGSGATSICSTREQPSITRAKSARRASAVCPFTKRLGFLERAHCKAITSHLSERLFPAHNVIMLNICQGEISCLRQEGYSLKEDSSSLAHSYFLLYHWRTYWKSRGGKVCSSRSPTASASLAGVCHVTDWATLMILVTSSLWFYQRKSDDPFSSKVTRVM